MLQGAASDHQFVTTSDPPSNGACFDTRSEPSASRCSELLLVMDKEEVMTGLYDFKVLSTGIGQGGHICILQTHGSDIILIWGQE